MQKSLSFIVHTKPTVGNRITQYVIHSYVIVDNSDHFRFVVLLRKINNQSHKENITMKSLYSTQATVTGGRAGTAKLNDSDLSINMVSPGSGKNGSNPEQLFAIGYAACFDGALAVVKQSQNAKFDSTTQATVELLKGGEHEYQLAAKIHVIAQNTDLSADDLQKLVEKAHEVCPYSKATKGNIDVTVSSEVQ